MSIREELSRILRRNPYAHTPDSTADHLIANGVTIQRWIPVTEQKAPDGVLVLCIGAKGGMFIGKMSSWQTATNGSVYCSVPNARSGRSATHWMPLPEPPKEET